MGGTLNYTDKGPTEYKCGGYIEGQPYNFTCPRSFKTKDCEGYTCNWSNYSCKYNKSGQFPDEQSCSDICKPSKYQICNMTTGLCEDCVKGTPKC